MATDNQGLHMQDPVGMRGMISNSCLPVKATNSQGSFTGLNAVKHSILAQYMPYISYYFQIVNVSKFWTTPAELHRNLASQGNTNLLHPLGLLLKAHRHNPVCKQTQSDVVPNVVPWTSSVSEIRALNTFT